MLRKGWREGRTAYAHRVMKWTQLGERDTGEDTVTEEEVKLRRQRKTGSVKITKLRHDESQRIKTRANQEPSAATNHSPDLFGTFYDGSVYTEIYD